MTAAEYEAVLDVMAERQPPDGTPDEAAEAFEAISYGISLFGDALILRLVDAKGEINDISLCQPVAVSLIRHLSKALLAVDWMDSAGKPTLVPE